MRLLRFNVAAEIDRLLTGNVQRTARERLTQMTVIGVTNSLRPACLSERGRWTATREDPGSAGPQ
jgi:hypothetical protein